MWSVEHCTHYVHFYMLSLYALCCEQIQLKAVAQLVKFAAEKHPVDSTIKSLARCLSFLDTTESQQLQNWLKRIVIGIEEDRENTGKMADNRLLLQALASHLVKEY